MNEVLYSKYFYIRECLSSGNCDRGGKRARKGRTIIHLQVGIRLVVSGYICFLHSQAQIRCLCLNGFGQKAAREGHIAGATDRLTKLQ